MVLILNIFLFYYYICFVHCDARIADIVVRITGESQGNYIPQDNEISFSYLKHTYTHNDVHNNRVVVNKILIPSPFTNDEPRTAKVFNFARFCKLLNQPFTNNYLIIDKENEFETDEIFYSSEHGQILDVDFRNMSDFTQSNLATLLSQTASTNP